MRVRDFVVTFGLLLLAVTCRSQWESTSDPAGDIIALASNNTTLFAGTGKHAAYLTSDNGSSWWDFNNVKPQFSCVSALSAFGPLVFAGMCDGRVFRSSDNGIDWLEASAGLTSAYPTSFAVIGTKLFIGTFGGVFCSTNNGTTWTSASTGLMSDSISALAVNGTNLFAATRGGIFVTTDNGANWILTGTTLAGMDVRSIASNGMDLFAGTENSGAFRSVDNGAHWAASNIGLTSVGVLAFAVSGNNIFASGDGVFHSSDSGRDWTDVSSGLSNGYFPIQALACVGPNLFEGSLTSGVRRRPLSQMIAASGLISNSFSPNLGENFPNPFTLRTTIPFSLPHVEHVSLKIFDILGHEITTLADQDFDAGTHYIEWVAGDAMPGVYYCRVATADGVQSRALVLTK